MTTTYDPDTQTVLDDNGDPLSIWDCDITGADTCPKCGGQLVFSWSDHPGGCDVLFCLNAVNLEHKTCDLIAERPGQCGRPGGGGGS